jgi:hypothetical protein
MDTSFIMLAPQGWFPASLLRLFYYKPDGCAQMSAIGQQDIKLPVPSHATKDIEDADMKINLVRSFFTLIVSLLILMLLFGTHIQAQHPVSGQAPAEMKEGKSAARRASTLVDESTGCSGYIKSFTATLRSGEWKKYVLAPSSFDGGFVVDVTPLAPSVDGAHVEHKVLPEFDGEQWNDVLWLILPEPAEPLKVSVRVYSTAAWQVVFQQSLALEPGEWQGYILQDAAVDAGYIIEINPARPGEYGDRVEKVLVQPEFFMRKWQDVLRIQIPEEQDAMQVEVKVYQAPQLALAAEFDTHLEPGVWHGFGVGPSSVHTGYVIEVTPLSSKDNQIERYTVQPEYNGSTWNDVARVMVPSDRPGLDVHIRIYAIQ